MEEKETKTIKFPEKEKKPLPDLGNEIGVVISLPRLTFTENSFSLVGACNKLRLSTFRGMGAYWEQALERLLIAVTEHKIKYALTIDYDTVFTEYHILDLYDIMEANPEIDALFPLQIRRNMNVPMFESFKHQKDEDGEMGILDISEEDAEADFFEVDSGHFGLTLIRTENLHKLKRPWFRSVPSTNNDWEAGKTPADLYFWKNAKNAGLKICLAPKVYIGHLDLFCVWPGKPENNWRAVQMRAHQSQVGCPKWAVPPSMDRYEYHGIN